MRKKPTTLHKPSRRTLNVRQMDELMAVDWKDKLRPAETLGMPEESTTMAMDRAFTTATTLLQHSMDLGMMPTAASFMGYPALQDISQNGIIRACIETVVDDMVREFGEVKTDDEDETSDTISTMENQLRKFKIQKVLHQAAEYVGYYGGCLVFIDTGAEDAQLQLPLNLTSKSEEMTKGKLQGFRVIDPINVFAGDYNSIDPLKDDFYKPRFWYVMGKRVHASRMIRFVANEVPQLYKPTYNFFGIAQAQILWDYVMHFSQCREATAELLTKQSMTVMKTNMAETLFQAGGTQELDRRMQLMAKYRNNNSVVAVDKEEEDIVNITAPMSGLTDVARQGLEFLAALNRTPAVKILGISPSGFNATGESDIRNYYDHIKSQREKLFGDGMRVIMHCIQMHTFGQIDPSMRFKWNELGNDDEAAMINVQKTKADVVGAYLDRNIISQEEARQFVASDPDSGLNFIDPDDVPEDPEQDENGMESMMGGQPEEENQNAQPEPQRAVQLHQEAPRDGRGIGSEGMENSPERTSLPH